MKAPVSVRYVCACETLLGVLTGFIGAMYVVYGFYGLIHLLWARVLLSAWISGLMLAIAVACFYTARGFSQGMRWAWNASWAIGLLAAFPGVHMVYLSASPWHGARGKEGWASMAGFWWLLPIVVGWIALIVPSTRRFVSADISKAEDH